MDYCIIDYCISCITVLLVLCWWQLGAPLSHGDTIPTLAALGPGGSRQSNRSGTEFPKRHSAMIAALSPPQLAAPRKQVPQGKESQRTRRTRARQTCSTASQPASQPAPHQNHQKTTTKGKKGQIPLLATD